MAGMILNTEFAFDQVGNSPAGPQRRCVAERFRASFQQLAEALQIRFAQLRLAAHASGLPQRLLSALVVLLRPPAHRLAADFQPNRDFGLVEIALLQQSNGFHPALLQRIKITCHSSRIPHTESNSFSRQKCRYIMRSSIIGSTPSLIIFPRSSRTACSQLVSKRRIGSPSLLLRNPNQNET